ncbi:MAG: ABC transporter permease [Xylanivirga thermophila]|jgi:putative ABC transport system permease protein|uniref:FtsX-like permease family protein n=1 Tax=Xylanivirga thermophila TaxID=2496273 RepID=UPI0039F58236
MKNYKEITGRYLNVQKKRTILTAIGIILSVALITAIGTMLVSMQNAMIQDEIDNKGDYHAILCNVPGDKIDNLKKHVKIEKAGVFRDDGFGVLQKMPEEQMEEYKHLPPYRYIAISAYDRDNFNIKPIKLKEGRLPQTEGEIALDYWTLEYLPNQPKVGDKIHLTTGIRIDKQENHVLTKREKSENEVFEKTSEKDYVIVGLIEPNTMGGYFEIGDGITYLDNTSISPNESYNINIKLNSVKKAHDTVNSIADDIGLVDESNIDFNENLLRLSAQSISPSLNSSLMSILAFIILLIIVATIAVIYNSFNISVLERISQFGMLRCVGASPGQIREIILREALILSIISIPIGLVCGVFAMQVVVYIISRFQFDIFKHLVIVLSPPVFIISSILGLITVYLSVRGPANQAAKVSPLDAVRNTGNFKKENFDKVKKAPVSRWLFGIEGEIAYKNLRRNKKRFNITVFSMIISIILYIVFSSFVNFAFSMDAVDLDKKIDFSVWGKRSGVFSQENYETIKNLSGVDKVYKYRNTTSTLLIPEDKITARFKELQPEHLSEKENGAVKLYNNAIISYGDENFDELKPYLKEGRIDIDALNKENGVLIVETSRVWVNDTKDALIDIVDYNVGDTIKITTDYDSDNPEYKTIKVAGILKQGLLNDKYNLNSAVNIITTEKVLQDVTGSDKYGQIYITLKEGSSKDAVAQYLKDYKEKELSIEYIDYAEQAKRDKNAAITMSIFLYGFVAVITLIGCLNIINTISTNLLLRTKELAVLKATGMTQGGIKKMVCLESIFYGIISAVYGSILGTGLSYILYTLFIGIREFAWVIPWKHIIISVLGATTIALLAGFAPLRKIGKGNIIESIRMEQ